MLALFKSYYRVEKINLESKRIPSTIASDVTKDQLNELNTLVKRMFESDKAYITVDKNEYGLYDIEFHSGIKGPINYLYFSSRFLAITHTFSTLKYILTQDYEKDKITTEIKGNCQHIDASKINIKLLKSDTTYESYYGAIHNVPLTFVYSSKYLSSDISQIMTAVSRKHDAFSVIQYALTNFGDSYFSLNNMLSIALAEMDKEDDYIALDDGETEAEKIQASKKIHDKLVQHKIISNQARYDIKKQGIQPGIILYSEDNDLNEQRTFIKKIDPTSGMGLYEMMVLQISKECGCVVPDIQVVISPSEWCMMSKDVSGPSDKLSDTKQSYQDLFYILFSPDTFLDIKNYRIYSGRQADESFTKIANIDKMSVAKIILMCILFNLRDIHNGNIGFRFREDNQQTIAELTLLDFQFDEFNNYNKASTIAEMATIFACHNNFDGPISTNSEIIEINVIEELCKGLTTEDYAKAFQSIKENFETAYALATTHSRKLMKDHFQSELRFELFPMEKEPAKELTNLWATNFKLLDEKLHNECKLRIPS